MGPSKASARNGDRDAEVVTLRERVRDLERERERLLHSTRKAENMADKAYSLTEKYFGMMKSKEDKTDKQGTEVAQLLREAKAKAEKAEEKANMHIKNLQTKLDEMSKRALEAEDALKDEKHQRDTENIRFKAEEDKHGKLVKESKIQEKKFLQALDVISALRKDLERSRAEKRAVDERERILIQLLQDTNKLVGAIVTNSHSVSERLTSCCSNLGELVGVVGKANVAVSNALVASQQGVRFVISELGESAQLKLLPGTCEDTLGRMEEEGYRGPTQFLPGASVNGVRDRMKESGKIMVKRRLEAQGQEATETAILRWREFYEDFVWTPATTIISRQTFTQFFFNIITTTTEDQLCRQLKRLHLDMSAEARIIGEELELAQDFHKECERYVVLWEGEFKKWQAGQAELSVGVEEAVAAIAAAKVPE